MRCIAVLLLLYRAMHVCSAYVTRWTGNMAGGMTCAILAFVGGVKTTGITIPPVAVSFNVWGGLLCCPKLLVLLLFLRPLSPPL